MQANAVKDRAVLLVGEREMDDPREVAGDLTRELADLTAERLRLFRDLELAIQLPAKLAEVNGRINALDRRRDRIHAQMHQLANHC